MGKRVVKQSVLPGERTDGSGRVCVHLFVIDDSGPFIEPHVLVPFIGPDGNLVKQRAAVSPRRGRLACDPRRTVAPVIRGGVTTITHRTMEAEAVTCPKCVVSKDYAKLVAKETADSTDKKE